MPYTARAAVVLAAALALSPACSQPSGQQPDPAGGDPRIRLSAAPSGALAVAVEGLPAEVLARLEHDPPTREAWQALLRVQVARADGAADGLPPVLGDYAVRDGALRFTPRFPFDPGLRYEVVFDPSSLASAPQRSPASPLRPVRTTIELPAPDRAPSTRVAAVYPSALEVPENHLRLYIVFSAPMGLGAGNPHIRLVDEDGGPLADPFLPLDVDLWNEDRTRFTVLYDPGRVKRGILPNEEMGRPLAVGGTYVLEIDAGWLDAEGQPLVAPFRREFRVGPAQERALDPADWRLEVPAAGTRDPLAVVFPAPWTTACCNARCGWRPPADSRWPGRSASSARRRAGSSRRARRGGRASTSSSPPPRWKTWPATASDGRSRSTRAPDRASSGPPAPGCRSASRVDLPPSAEVPAAAGPHCIRSGVRAMERISPQRKRTATVLAAALGAVAAGVIAAAGAANPEWTAPPGADFPLTGGNYWHQRYSALDQVNTSNVATLGAAWLVGLEGGRPGGQLEGTPVVVDGVMYVSTGTRNVLALDAATGAVKWRYRPESAGPIGGNKGVAVADGKVFLGRRDGVLVALDQGTGEVAWETRLTDEPGAYVSAPAVHHDGLVCMGTSGRDSGARGQMGAYDAETGREVWKFHTIPGADDRFADTWEGSSYRNGGGGVWVSPTLDPELGMIYLSVGNVGLRQYGAADRNPDFRDEGDRGFDNLFTASVLALDLKTGEYRWNSQQRAAKRERLNESGRLGV